MVARHLSEDELISTSIRILTLVKGGTYAVQQGKTITPKGTCVGMQQQQQEFHLPKPMIQILAYKDLQFYIYENISEYHEHKADS